MKRLGYWFAAVCLLGVMWVEKPLYAQRPGQYTPSRGPLSPYFGLFQYNGSPLPNYQAFVNRGRKSSRVSEMTPGGSTALSSSFASAIRMRRVV